MRPPRSFPHSIHWKRSEFPGVWSPQKLPKLTPLPDPPVPISEQTASYLRRAAEVSERSGGALDCTVGALTKLWDIGGERARVPSPGEIAAALQTVGWKQVSLEARQAKLKSGRRLI